MASPLAVSRLGGVSLVWNEWFDTKLREEIERRLTGARLFIRQICWTDLDVLHVVQIRMRARSDGESNKCNGRVTLIFPGVLHAHSHSFQPL